MLASVRYDKKRGCGYRSGTEEKPGLYIVSPTGGTPCCRLPKKVIGCSCCGLSPYPDLEKPNRGLVKAPWKWVMMGAETELLCLEPKQAKQFTPHCPLRNHNYAEWFGMMWVGESHYPTPGSFLQEVKEQGISKRVSSIPHWLVPGHSMIGLVHSNVSFVQEIDGEMFEYYAPAIFHMFTFHQVEVVVDKPEIDDDSEAARLVAQLADQLGEGVVTPVFTEIADE